MGWVTVEADPCVCPAREGCEIPSESQIGFDCTGCHGWGLQNSDLTTFQKLSNLGIHMAIPVLVKSPLFVGLYDTRGDTKCPLRIAIKNILNVIHPFLPALREPGRHGSAPTIT